MVTKTGVPRCSFQMLNMWMISWRTINSFELKTRNYLSLESFRMLIVYLIKLPTAWKLRWKTRGIFPRTMSKPLWKIFESVVRSHGMNVSLSGLSLSFSNGKIHHSFLSKSFLSKTSFSFQLRCGRSDYAEWERTHCARVLCAGGKSSSASWAKYVQS